MTKVIRTVAPISSGQARWVIWVIDFESNQVLG